MGAKPLLAALPPLLCALLAAPLELDAARYGESAPLFFFAKDAGALESIKLGYKILNYRSVHMGEQLFRETYLDHADLRHYFGNASYRITERFDGKVTIDREEAGEGGRTRRIVSVAIRPDEARRAKNGVLPRAKMIGIGSVEPPQSPQLFVESYRYRILLRGGRERKLLLTLFSGRFVGLAGKKLATPFWGIQLQAFGGRSLSGARELRRVADFLATEFKLRGPRYSLYKEGMERAVLLRPEEAWIVPVHALGGSRGKGLEQFNVPDAVAFTPDGRLVAGDTDNARFKIYGLSDQALSLRVVGGEGSAPGQFGRGLVTRLADGREIHHQVQGIAVDKKGLIYVVDQGNLRIQAFDPEGRPLPDRTLRLRYCPTETPICADGLAQPSGRDEYRSVQGIAIDEEGALYLSDKGTNRVYRLLPDGRPDPEFRFPARDSETQKTLLREPESLAVYGSELLVADEKNGQIKRFDRRSGRFLGAFGTEHFGGHVEGLAIAGDHLFAVDPNQNRLVVFDMRGTSPSFVAALAGDFESADGVAVDPTGRFLAVADQGNYRILVYSLPEIWGLLNARRGGEGAQER